MALSWCLRKELKVQTPFQAIEKWFEMNLETFSQKPDEFKYKVFILRILTKQVGINNHLQLNTFQYITDEIKLGNSIL